MESHVLLFPFMSKGHTVPFLHLSRLLLHRRIPHTIFTTPANLSFISSFLSNDVVLPPEISILTLPFPSDAPLPGLESTDSLPSMSHFLTFAASTKLLQPGFEAAVRRLSNVKLLISDGFLPWTLQSANKFNIPRLVFYGMNYSSLILIRASIRAGLFSGPESDNEPIAVPDFPWIKLARNQMPYPFNVRSPTGPYVDRISELEKSEASSDGILFNSFYELEKPFIDYWAGNCGPRAWSIGPVCLSGTEKKQEALEKPNWMQWMDEMLEQGKRVLYVAFGTQAELSSEQLKEIATGLERSGVNFLWVVRLVSKEQEEIIDELEQKANSIRGLVVRDWVDQRSVLGHKAVNGFMSHCGWNSVMESTCAGVPILTWPMMAEQVLNARMVVAEMGTGMRLESCEAAVVEKAVKELMEGGPGQTARVKAKEVAQAARKAMDQGGSSCLALEDLLHEFHITKNQHEQAY
ncbi:hypothetical protein V2J09_008269 [Rumex salicifolius]